MNQAAADQAPVSKKMHAASAKASFHVSAHPKSHIPSASRAFVVNPYVAEKLEDSHAGERFDNIAIATPSRSTREEFLRDHDFVDRKYQKYVPILAERMNQVHGTYHDQIFWRKAFALTLVRHLAYCFDLFRACEANLRPEEHDCRILSEDSYVVIKDFNEHRRFFEYSDYGQEQLFSVYCHQFHPDRFAQYRDAHEWRKHTAEDTADGGSIWRLFAKLGPHRLARRLLRLRKPTVAIINSYFAQEHLDRLLFETYGRVQHITLPSISLPSSAVDWSAREIISERRPDFDRFDQFVFSTLRHGVPRALVEDFAALCSHYSRFLESLKSVRWIVCESWIGDAAPATLLALAREAGIRHLYNEHNYLAHPFLGNNLKYILPVVDEYATVGWHDERAANLTRSASLFSWKAPRREKPTTSMLIVGSIATVHPPEINASYGESGAFNAESYYRFMNTFLAGLPPSLLAEAIYRGYPDRFAARTVHYDEHKRLGQHFKSLRYNNDSRISGRSLIADARLVVVSYLSTAYLEALVSDVPTIVLWNRETYMLDEDYAGVFDDLLRSGIFQDDPAKAADFVASVAASPEEWWSRKHIRAARARFLEQNIGEPSTMIELLTNRARVT